MNGRHVNSGVQRGKDNMLVRIKVSCYFVWNYTPRIFRQTQRPFWETLVLFWARSSDISPLSKLLLKYLVLEFPFEFGKQKKSHVKSIGLLRQQNGVVLQQEPIIELAVNAKFKSWISKFESFSPEWITPIAQNSQIFLCGVCATNWEKFGRKCSIVVEEQLKI